MVRNSPPPPLRIIQDSFQPGSSSSPPPPPPSSTRPSSFTKQASQAPEKLSEAELQPIIDELIGAGGSVLSQQLPGLLESYERIHGAVILDTEDHDTLRKLCTQHSDLELGPQELFHFLTTIPKRISRPVSPTPVEVVIPSISAALSSPTERPRRRHSDRVKSPSDSSSSSSEDDAARRKRASRKAPRSAPASTQTTRAFPVDTYALPAALPSSADGPRASVLPRRMKTVSESSARDDSPFSTRMRAAMVPPSSYNNIGFSRPPPAGHWRRQSRDFSGHSADDAMTSPDGPGPVAKLFSRSLSSSSITFSPPRSKASGRDSPISPSVDSTSFHNAKSPPTDQETDNSLTDIRTEEPSDFDLDISLDGDSLLLVPTEDDRLNKLTTVSSASLRSSHDKLRELQKQNTELQRKLQETRRAMDIAGAENDRMVADLQTRLDESETQLALRKKEDNERRGKERSQALAMASLESEVDGLKRTLEHSRSTHLNIQKMYSAQCEESQRLRDVMRNKEDEIRELEDLHNTHQMEETKFGREVKALEHEIERLQSDLVSAQQAEHILETQKQENMQLKETIDRMRFEMEEMRGPQVSVTSSTQLPATPSGPPTLSRNLGAEMSRRMDSGELGDPMDAPVRERVIETVITRTTVINQGHSRTMSDSTVVNRDVEYVDASVGTDPLPNVVVLDEAEPEAEAGPSHRDDIPPHSPPAYTAKAEPINEEEVLAHAHPRDAPFFAYHVDDDEYYDFLQHSVGLRCKGFEDELDRRRAKHQKLVEAGVEPATGGRSSNHLRRKRSQTVGHGATPDQHSGTRVGPWAVMTAAAFAIGIAVGTSIMGSGQTGVNARDAQLFTHMNTIAVAAGVGEGFFPNAVAGALDQGARLFVPT